MLSFINTLTYLDMYIHTCVHICTHIPYTLIQNKQILLNGKWADVVSQWVKAPMCEDLCLISGIFRNVQSETLVQGWISWVKEASRCSHWVVEHDKGNVRTCS